MHHTDEIREHLRLVRRRHRAALDLVASVCSQNEKEAIETLRETTAAFEEIAARMCEISDATLGGHRALKNALED